MLANCVCFSGHHQMSLEGGGRVSYFRGGGHGWGGVAVRLRLGSLYNEVQCIMGNGGDGDMKMSAVYRMIYRKIDTTEQECIPVGCVLPAAVAVGLSPPGTPPKKQTPPLDQATHQEQTPQTRHPNPTSRTRQPPPPPPRGQTHACKHITLPQISFAGGKDEHPATSLAGGKNQHFSLTVACAVTQSGKSSLELPPSIVKNIMIMSPLPRK